MISSARPRKFSNPMSVLDSLRLLGLIVRYILGHCEGGGIIDVDMSL